MVESHAITCNHVLSRGSACWHGERERSKDRPGPWLRKHAAVAGYERAYPNWLEEYRYKKFRFLEIGLESGRSLHTWLEYFPSTMHTVQ